MTLCAVVPVVSLPPKNETNDGTATNMMTNNGYFSFSLSVCKGMTFFGMRWRGVRFLLGWLLAACMLVACETDEDWDPADRAEGVVRAELCYAEFDAGRGAGRSLRVADYDRVEFLVADGQGVVVEYAKAYYDAPTATVRIEGLQPGDYRLMVAAARGDWAADSVVFARVRRVDEPWLRFPVSSGEGTTAGRALAAEYFHSATDFRVWLEPSASGGLRVASDLPSAVEQRRVVGRWDVALDYAHSSVRDAVVGARAELRGGAFYTSLTAAGVPGDVWRPAAGVRVGLSSSGGSFLLLPTLADDSLRAAVSLTTRTYLGDTLHRAYVATVAPVEAGRIHRTVVQALHPEDEVGTLFVTAPAYAAAGHGLILQDDEPHTVYTDPQQRSFNTARPLQVGVTDEGELSLRFYSPKPLRGVLIRGKLPATEGEYVDMAYLDSLPAFADFRQQLPATVREAMYRTASGRIVRLPRLSAEELQEADFQISSADPYWQLLQRIEHGWNIRFELYGGDPTRPDGGPSGNWMGIRPVHLREVVAFFLNFTFMIDMPEHEAILRANEDRLYGNGGPDDKVTAETVLAQMRQPRSLRVGLVYTGNLVMGLGGGDVFGAYQGGWFEHYTSTYACEVMFHELGHVMGYSHDSSFTYGPWAQELMNNFYVQNLSKMPVESAGYLNSASNPHRYM